MTVSTTNDVPQRHAPAAPAAIRALSRLGQSVWLDYLRRGTIRSGELAAMVAAGLGGVTTNPSIFEKAIAGSADYDDALADPALSRRSDADVLERLAIEDVREAADVLRSTYDATDGGDGFVSIEVSPRLARDTRGSIADARRLWKAVGRPNVMIKIPGTREGWPAIELCLRDGININVTLLFAMENYRAVADAYMSALEARVSAGLPIDRVASVASLFVSRVDTAVDDMIDASGAPPPLAALRGRVAIANARLVYAAFLLITRSARWRALAARGARLQRPLWASTGTKDPSYSDVKYVEALIGPHTITTVPPDTLRAFAAHGSASRGLPGDVAAARRTMSALASAGIDFGDVARRLEEEGITSFHRSMARVLSVISEKRSPASAATAVPVR